MEGELCIRYFEKDHQEQACGLILEGRGDRRIIVKTNASWHDAINLYKRLDFVEHERTALGIALELVLAVS